MGNVHEALRRAESEQPGRNPLLEPWGRGVSAEPVPPLPFPPGDLDQANSLQPAEAADPRLVALTDAEGPGAEQFRVLSFRLKDLRNQGVLRKILVTSSVAGEGKSVIAANLAISLARAGQQKVLLLGGDLRCLALNRLLGCNGLRGLSEYLRADDSFHQYLYRVEPLALWFLPSGAGSTQALQLLQSSRLKQLLDTLSNSFDWIVIDSPPLIPLADANMWARMADGTLLVVREGKTPKKPLRQALDSLGNLSLLGIVVNECAHMNGSEYYKSEPK